MSKIRVMVIDGEVASRRSIGRALEGDPAVELVGASSGGPEAVDKVSHLQPDLVVLGVGPKGDGLECLALIRAAHPELPVLVAGPDAHRGTPLSLEALSLGASGYVATAGRGPDVGPIPGLASKVRALVGSSQRPEAPRQRERIRPVGDSGETPAPAAPIEAVVIGSSTGGPDGLAAVIAAMPADLPVPVLIVQHIPESFTKSLAGRLDALCAIPVREAVHAAVAPPGTAWVAPWGSHLEVGRERGALRMRLVDGPPENQCCPSVDVLFRSAAAGLGARVLAVVLTGMGRDGLRGCRAVRSAGGIVVVQDEATSVIWGMPGNVAEAGLAHKILPLGEIGPEIVRRARSGRPRPSHP